ncbi:MAG: MaoC family dehydratase [Deltaproteobacteria bacterium]|nr:MaoC family dehydratase [Deltaproteobacteria bacterium]
MSLTDPGSYYENFTVGDIYEHSRGKTISETEHQWLTLLVMNTAQVHFNHAMVSADPDTYIGGKRIVYGGIVLSTVLGLTSEDCAENSITEIGMNNGKHPNPVFAGDTLFASSEVLETRDAPDRDDAGIVKFKHMGKNQDGKVVVEIEREVLIKKQAKWARN